jgi:ubiquinone/menaquinone biosynthesis C-methylase UbiE
MSINKTTEGLWEVAHKSDSWSTDHDYPTPNAIAFQRYHVKPYAEEINNGSLYFLDIGCGSGANTIYFAGFGYNVFGIDCSDTAISKTLNRIRTLEPSKGLCDVKAEVGNFLQMQFNDIYFDAILSDGVFYYGNEVSFKAAVMESFRVLKKNGILRVYTKSARDFMAIRKNEVSNHTYEVKIGYEKRMTVYCPPKGSIQNIFNQFSDVTIGIEEFNYIDTSNIKSYWVITAIK